MYGQSVGGCSACCTALDSYAPSIAMPRPRYSASLLFRLCKHIHGAAPASGWVHQVEGQAVHRAAAHPHACTATIRLRRGPVHSQAAASGGGMPSISNLTSSLGSSAAGSMPGAAVAWRGRGATLACWTPRLAAGASSASLPASAAAAMFLKVRCFSI